MWHPAQSRFPTADANLTLSGIVMLFTDMSGEYDNYRFSMHRYLSKLEEVAFTIRITLIYLTIVNPLFSIFNPYLCFFVPVPAMMLLLNKGSADFCSLHKSF
jgi:hypothetical protein